MPQAMACGGILQCSPGIGLESCRDMQSQHSLWPDDDGAGSRSPVLLRISTPLAGERALCEVAKTATLAAHHSHSVDCKAERVRPGKCGNDTPIVSSASWCRLKTVTRYGRRTSPRRRGTSRLTAQ